VDGRAIVITLLWPWAFVALPLPLLVRWLLRPRQQQDAALRVPDVGRFNPAAIARGAGKRGSLLALLLAWLAWACLLGAVARPQFTGDPISLPSTGRDLMLAVDISGSMNTEDMDINGHVANRLAAVKAVVTEFIAHRAGDRVGLILFGTNAYLQAPLTFDLATVEQLLDEAPVGIAGGKTAIGDAIGLAVKRLRTRPAESRVLILLTDGANNVGEVPPEKAAELARAEGVKIYTIGVGAEELKVPGFWGEIGGRIVNPSADLDAKSLQAIAETTGGRFFRARDTAELSKIYGLLDSIEPTAQDARNFRPVKALFFYPLAASWTLWLIVLLFGARPGVLARA
jgi:Ca-activated chloride channel family protein